MIDSNALAAAEKVQVERRDGLVAAKGSALAMRVTDVASHEKATELARQAKALWAAYDAERTAITKPMLEAKRRVDNFFKPALDALSSIEAHLKSEIGAYILAQVKERVVVMEHSAAVIATGGVPTAAVPEVPVVKGVSTRVVWAYEVVDANAVPREFCSPDEKKISAALWYADTPHKEPLPIPGIRFYLDTSTTVRK